MLMSVRCGMGMRQLLCSQPSFGVKTRMSPLPLLFAIYMNDIDSIADVAKGALTGTPNFFVTHMLFADDLCLMSIDRNHMQTVVTMLNKLQQAYPRRKSLTVNT